MYVVHKRKKLLKPNLTLRAHLFKNVFTLEKLANFIPENSGLDTAGWGKSGRLTSGYLGTGLHPDRSELD